MEIEGLLPYIAALLGFVAVGGVGWAMVEWCGSRLLGAFCLPACILLPASSCCTPAAHTAQSQWRGSCVCCRTHCPPTGVPSSSRGAVGT